MKKLIFIKKSVLLFAVITIGSFCYGQFFPVGGYQGGLYGSGGDEIAPDHGFMLDAKVALEGPWAIFDMDTWLNDNGLLPLTQPYNLAPWNYSGTESVVAIPNPDIVDWVLIELRDAADAPSATDATMIAQKAAFLLSDGSIVDINGFSLLYFDNSILQQLYLVIYHRNHLSIMSANPLPESGGTYTYDFTTDNKNNQAYGTDAQKFLGNGIYGMYGGDGNADGVVNISDKNPLWELEAGTQGYIASDFNMDMHSNNMDKDDIWNPNFGSGSQVPGGDDFTCGDLLLDPRDAQSYQTVLIGTQCWMAENLNIGTMLIAGINQTDNALFEKYCDENNPGTCDTYGGLYQWNEAMQYTTTAGAQGICPDGWHLPTDDEWCILENYVDAGSVSCSATGFRGTDAGFNLKSTSGWSSSGNGSGLYSFNALPGGYSHSNGSFGQLTHHAHFWSSVENGVSAWKRNLYYNSDEVNRTTNNKLYGHSVRCIKN